MGSESDSESEDSKLTNHPVIKKANELASVDIQNFVLTPQVIKNQSYDFEILLCSELSKSAEKEIWDIVEDNMRELCINSSFGWKPRKKRKELFHELSRFLLVRASENLGNTVGKRVKKQPILAYSMFRFEHEDERNVVYCYELQTHLDGRRKGLGKAMIAALEAICKGMGLSWIMLTVLIANESADNFYDTVGFTLDESSSPTSDDDYDIGNGEREKYDYRILSKRVDSSTGITDAVTQ